MSRIQSRLECRAHLLEPTGTAEKVLVVEVLVDCPGCGQYQAVKIAGHHLHHLRTILDEMIAAYPDLTGDESGIEVLNRFNLKGRPPSDPSVN